MDAEVWDAVEVSWRDDLLEVLTATASDGSAIVLTPAHTVEVLKAQGWTPPVDVLVMHCDHVVKPDGSIVEAPDWLSSDGKHHRDGWLAGVANSLLAHRRSEDLGREVDRDDSIGLATNRGIPKAVDGASGS